MRIQSANLKRQMREFSLGVKQYARWSRKNARWGRFACKNFERL